MSGRKRKPGKRYANGRLMPAQDKGTPELQAKRQALVGPGGNPNESTYLLGILCERRLITPAQRDAGEHYGFVYCVVNGKPFPRAMDLERAPRGFSDNGPSQKIEDRYREMAAALARISRSTKDAVDNVCAHDRIYRRMFADNIRGSDNHLVTGLEALTRLMR